MEPMKDLPSEFEKREKLEMNSVFSPTGLTPNFSELERPKTADITNLNVLPLPPFAEDLQLMGKQAMSPLTPVSLLGQYNRSRIQSPKVLTSYLKTPVTPSFPTPTPESDSNNNSSRNDTVQRGGKQPMGYNNPILTQSQNQDRVLGVEDEKIGFQVQRGQLELDQAFKVPQIDISTDRDELKYTGAYPEQNRNNQPIYNVVNDNNIGVYKFPGRGKEKMRGNVTLPPVSSINTNEEVEINTIVEEKPTCNFLIKPARRPSRCYLPDIPDKAYSHPYKYDILVSHPVKFSEWDVKFRLRTTKTNEYVDFSHKKKPAIRLEKINRQKTEDGEDEIRSYRVVFQVCSFHFQRSPFVLEVFMEPPKNDDTPDREYQDENDVNFSTCTSCYVTSPFEMFARKNKKSDKEWPTEEEAEKMLQDFQKKQERKRRDLKNNMRQVRSNINEAEFFGSKRVRVPRDKVKVNYNGNLQTRRRFETMEPITTRTRSGANRDDSILTFPDEERRKKRNPVKDDDDDDPSFQILEEEEDDDEEEDVTGKKRKKRPKNHLRINTDVKKMKFVNHQF